MRRPVALPGNRLSPLATAGLDRWPSKTELGLQTPLTFARRAFGRGVCLRKAVRAGSNAPDGTLLRARPGDAGTGGLLPCRRAPLRCDALCVHAACAGAAVKAGKMRRTRCASAWARAGWEKFDRGRHATRVCACACNGASGAKANLGPARTGAMPNVARRRRALGESRGALRAVFSHSAWRRVRKRNLILSAAAFHSPACEQEDAPARRMDPPIGAGRAGKR